MGGFEGGIIAEADFGALARSSEPMLVDNFVKNFPGYPPQLP